MARQDTYHSGTSTRGATPSAVEKGARTRSEWMRQGWFRLLALVFLAELFVPFLLWPVGLPRAVDGLRELAPVIAVLITFMYMLKEDRTPGAVLVMLGITFIWGLVATLEGQGLAATTWGWWRLFKYPILGIFAYLVQDWPKDFARWFLRFCIGLLLFELGVQLVQLAMGMPVGDSLAGTLGWKGVMQYSMMTFFIVCLGLGHWLATQEWKTLFLILLLGFVGSMLNGTKFYLFAVGWLVGVTLVIHLVRGGQFRQLFLSMFIFALAAVAFITVYNSYLVNSRGLRPLQEYLQPETMERYLFTDGQGDIDGLYNLGRGLAVTYSWQQIRRDPTTTLFGFGLGTRTESSALGVSGLGLEQDIYGGVGSTTLGAWIQEHGLLGLGVFLLFNLWISLKLIRFARATSDPYQATLAFGLLLFTLSWPVWIWYHKAWIAGVMMVLYWVSLGYIFRQLYSSARRVARRV